MVFYPKIFLVKLIITFVDNNNFYYKIKNKLPNLKTISIQNGLRPEYFFCELSKNKELKSDYILTWGDEIAKKYKENINTQTITIGSFYNNFIKKYKKKRNSVAFISSGYGMNKVQMRIFSGTNKNKFFMEANKYFSAEKILVPKIYEYCKKNNLEFEVIGRCEKNAKGSYWSRPDKEHKFYKDILSDGNFKYHEKNDAYSCYQIADESKLSISIYSAFGLEALARKLRIVFFNIRDFSTDHKSLNLFWPAKISDRGEFWTNSMNETEVKRVLNYALFAKEEDWNNSIKKVIPSLINFDADNSIFVKLLNKLL